MSSIKERLEILIDKTRACFHFGSSWIDHINRFHLLFMFQQHQREVYLMYATQGTKAVTRSTYENTYQKSQWIADKEMTENWLLPLPCNENFYPRMAKEWDLN